LARSGGAHSLSYRFNEFPALIGIAIGPAFLVPLAAVIAEIPFWLQGHYGSNAQTRYKTPFNIGQTAITVGMTVLIGSLGTPPISLIAAAIVSNIFGEILISRAIVLVTGNNNNTYMKENWDLRIGLPVLVALLATGLLALPGDGRIMIAAIPTVLILAYKVSDEWIKIVRDRDMWRRMDQVSNELIGKFEEVAVITTALSSALKLFNASYAEIMLIHPHTSWSYTLEEGSSSGVDAQPLPGGAPELEETRSRSVIPLTAAGGRSMGRLVLEFANPTKRPEQRQQLLNTFATSIATNLLVARLYETQKKQAETKAYEANHDTLTSLGNRAMLYEVGPAKLSEAATSDKTTALLLFDLDGFKRINDTLGHAAGDRVLIEIATRIFNTVRKSDVTVRLGGDEFAVLAHDLTTPSDAELLATKIIEELVPTISVEGIDLTVEASIGIAIYGQDATDIDGLLKASDIAMYQAKANGRGTWARYESHSDAHTTEGLSLQNDLRRALINNELVLHYQPQVSIKTGEVVGMEALVRWNHPTLGLMPPAKFVPIAEQSGMIQSFTLAILEQAIRDHARLRGYIPNATMSVNLSARNLLDQSLPQDLARLLGMYAVPATNIVIEITETVAPNDSAAVDRVLYGIHALGCGISLDDFGTGYSSLASLQRPNISEVKVDRDFVRRMLTTEGSAVMVRSIVQMAHGWNCRVVAEGVEDQMMIDHLAEMDCDIAQGYYIKRPSPIREIEAWLRAGAKPVGKLLVEGEEIEEA